MQVKNLLQILQHSDPNAEIVISIDEEMNELKKIENIHYTKNNKNEERLVLIPNDFINIE